MLKCDRLVAVPAMLYIDVVRTGSNFPESLIAAVLRAGGLNSNCDLSNLDPCARHNFVVVLGRLREFAWHDGDLETLRVIEELLQDVARSAR